MPSVITVRPTSDDENCGWIFNELGGHESDCGNNDEAVAYIEGLGDETVIVKYNAAGALISIWWRKNGKWSGRRLTEAEADYIEELLAGAS